MTATATEVSPEALSLADALLARADLWLYRDVTADHARYALARALDRDGPTAPTPRSWPKPSAAAAKPSGAAAPAATPPG
jgi:hypothetical protein